MTIILKTNSVNNSRYYILNNENDKKSYVVVFDNNNNIVSIKKKTYENVTKHLFLDAVINVDDVEEEKDMLRSKIKEILEMI